MVRRGRAARGIIREADMKPGFLLVAPPVPGSAEYIPKARELSEFEVQKLAAEFGPKLGIACSAKSLGIKSNPIRLAKALYALGLVPEPVRAVLVASSFHPDKVRSSIGFFASQATIVYDDTASLGEPAVEGRFEEKPASMFDGMVSADVAACSGMLSVAADIANICFLGRGAPAGVDWAGAVQRLAVPGRLDGLLRAATFGHEADVPDFPEGFEAWRIGEIWRGQSSSEFVRSVGETTQFREAFECRPLACAEEPPALSLARRMKDVLRIWRHALYADTQRWYDLDDVDPDQPDAADDLEDVGAVLGVDSYLDAFYAGVPLEDLLFT